jgi:hypothetical protein
VITETDARGQTHSLAPCELGVTKMCELGRTARLGLLTAALIIAPAAARADTQTVTQQFTISLPSSPTALALGVPVSFDSQDLFFDAALGTLTEVEMSLTGSVIWSFPNNGDFQELQVTLDGRSGFVFSQFFIQQGGTLALNFSGASTDPILCSLNHALTF